jgi:hypothetical protein
VPFPASTGRGGHRDASTRGEPHPARFLFDDGDEIPVETRLVRRDDRRWRIGDGAVRQISVVGISRSQIDRIIRAYSYPELIRRMTHRLATL